MMIMIVPLWTKPSGLYRHRRGLGFTQSRLQRRKSNIRIAKLVFHAKESPIRTQDEVLILVSSRPNSPAKVYSSTVLIPPNLGIPQSRSKKKGRRREGRAAKRRIAGEEAALQEEGSPARRRRCKKKGSRRGGGAARRRVASEEAELPVSNSEGLNLESKEVQWKCGSW